MSGGGAGINEHQAGGWTSAGGQMDLTGWADGPQRVGGWTSASGRMGLSGRADDEPSTSPNECSMNTA